MSGTESSDGETTSWDSVKVRVQEIVDGEDKKNPLNDDEIAECLKKEGLDVSRRTIVWRSCLGDVFYYGLPAITEPQ